MSKNINKIVKKNVGRGAQKALLNDKAVSRAALGTMSGLTNIVIGQL